MEYNPFNKSLGELNEVDLKGLLEHEIAEGWYIEYKSSVPKSGTTRLDQNKISKSISSFANTKGGWIFWGISTSNDSNKPLSIDGVDLTGFSNFEDQVAQVINSNISPRPAYHFKRVELETRKTVFVIQVEESPTPPYITSQGVIYQRENNESKPIRDRYIIEKLNEKADSYYEAIERFTVLDLPQTKGQNDWNQTYLELYLMPLPFDSFRFEKFYHSDFFQKVAARFYMNVDVNFLFEGEPTKIVPLNLGFNSIFSSERSLIIRPLSEKNLIYKSTTVELFENGNLKVLLPLFEFDAKSIPEHYKNSKTIEYLLDKYSPLETIARRSFYPGHSNYDTPPTTGRKETDFVNHIKFIDGLELIFAIMIIIAKYKSVLEDSNFDLEINIGFRSRITDSWRKFVFFDDDDYLEKIKLYNIPLSPKSEIEIPEFKKGSGYKIKLNDNHAYFDIAKFILEGIGLPDSHSIKFADILKKGAEHFKTKEDN